MIALMNYIVLILLVIGAGVAWKVKKFWPLVVAAALALVYTVAQPTYMPKGTVPAPRVEETAYIDKPMIDRSLKPMSDAERDARRNEQLKQINDSIESKIQKGE